MQKLQDELERDAKAKEEEEARLKREAEDAFAIIGDLDSALKVNFCTSQTLVAKLSLVVSKHNLVSFASVQFQKKTTYVDIVRLTV